MAIKEYRHNGGTYQFDEEDAPQGAELVDEEGTGEKARTPRNKAVKPNTK